MDNFRALISILDVFLRGSGPIKIMCHLTMSSAYLICKCSVLLFGFQAYVQQLESSRMKLTQLEQELQRARQQVLFCLVILYMIYPWNPISSKSLLFLNLVSIFSLVKGIFISNSGEQAQSMGGNGIIIILLNIWLWISYEMVLLLKAGIKIFSVVKKFICQKKEKKAARGS